MWRILILEWPKGKARVITDLADADQVQPGEILVTHHTSPGWTPLFSLIAGLVTEEGKDRNYTFIVRCCHLQILTNFCRWNFVPWSSCCTRV